MSMRERCKEPISVSSISSSVQRLAKEDPDAFVLLYFQATSLSVEVDPAGYEYLMAGVMLKTFRESGLIIALEQVRMWLCSGDGLGTPERLDAIRDWSRRIEDLASQRRLQELLAEHEKAAARDPTVGQGSSYLM
jgi:hypothetical protein